MASVEAAKVKAWRLDTHTQADEDFGYIFTDYPEALMSAGRAVADAWQLVRQAQQAFIGYEAARAAATQQEADGQGSSAPRGTASGSGAHTSGEVTKRKKAPKLSTEVEERDDDGAPFVKVLVDCMLGCDILSGEISDEGSRREALNRRAEKLCKDSEKATLSRVAATW